MEGSQYDDKRRDLLEKYGFICPIMYLTCRRIDCDVPVVTRCARYPKWCLRFSCTSCKRTWNVCHKCIALNREFKCIRSVKEKRIHNELHIESNESKEEQNSEISCSLESSISTDEVFAENELEEDLTDEISFVDHDASDKKRKLRPINAADLQKVLGMGVMYNFCTYNLDNLGGNYLLSKPIERKDKASNYSKEDVDLHILLSYLFFRLTKSERMLFSKVMR